MILAIIQARMGSTRFPGKILMEIDGKPLLQYQIDRIKESLLLDRIVVATSTVRRDDVIEEFCIKNDINCFRGSENDVLNRYYNCARKFNASIVVRLTADCPLIDPKIIDETISLFLESKVDFAANTAPPETSMYPEGVDVEVFSYHALSRAERECENSLDREHVTLYFWRYNENFSTIQLKRDTDVSKYRITIDYAEDFAVMEFLISELKRQNKYGYLDDIVAILNENPEIRKLNSDYQIGTSWG